MFRTSYVHHQEDYIVYAALCDIFSMRLSKQSTFNLVDCLHRCMNNISLMMNISCSKHVEDKKN